MYNCSNGQIYICNCHHFGPKIAIVAKLCFFYLLYYCEVRYPISNQENPSFINLDIQRQFTENV